jgi:hypothetical protein
MTKRGRDNNKKKRDIQKRGERQEERKKEV